MGELCSGSNLEVGPASLRFSPPLHTAAVRQVCVHGTPRCTSSTSQLPTVICLSVNTHLFSLTQADAGLQHLCAQSPYTLPVVWRERR